MYLKRTLIAAGVALAALAATAAAPVSTHGPQPRHEKPTVVLVHGAFADSSSWNGVIDDLQRKGYPVIAPANPFAGCTTTRSTLPASWTAWRARSCSPATPTAGR
nr:hypothetical protein GCM10025730_22130 [Promicromonospora thailandica]